MDTIGPGASRRAILSISLAAAVSGLVATARPSAAETSYPSRTITLVCPYSAGATTDGISRIVAQALQAELGSSHPIIVENRTGAGGNVGTASAAKSDPDGYTLVLGALGPFATNAAIYPRLGFDPEKDFTPLALVASIPLALVVNPKVGVDDVKALVEKASADPQIATYASAGGGTPHHLAGELFARAAKVDLLHTPYKGAAPAMNDVVAGHVPFMFDALVAVMPQVKSGTVKALAVTSAERAKTLPDVPTLKELGFDVVVNGWYGILAPAKTPDDVKAKLVAALARVVARDDVRQKLRDLGSEEVSPDPAGFARLISTEAARWQPLIKELGIRAD